MKTLAAPLIALTLLAGCSRKEASVPPAAPAAPVKQVAATPAPVAGANDRYAPLMRAVFGTGYRPDQGNALVTMPDPYAAGMQTPLLLTGIASTQLPSGMTVLAVAGEDVDSNDDADSSLGQPGYLSVYLLREENGQWRVLRRHENIAKLGSHGQVGKVSWVTLGPGRPGMAIESRVSNRGQTNGYLALFDPAAEKAAVLTDGMLIHSDNDDDCEDYRPKCWNNTATWRLDSASSAAPYHDVVLDIKSTLRNAKPGAIAAAEQAGGDIARDEWTGQSTARYVFTDGQYRLREGKNEIEPQQQ